MKIIPVICFLFLFVNNNPVNKRKTIIQNTGSKVTKAQAQEALDYHNQARKEVGVQPLEWSEELAKHAQEWADHLAETTCKMAHRPKDGKFADNYGENLFSGSGKEYTALDASKAWYKEIKDFKNLKLSGSNWSKTGHYSQMIWNKTTKIGMGIAKCKNGKTIIVANYDPAGNMLGDKAY